MATYSTDRNGILYFRESNHEAVLFDRVNNIVVTGWSNRAAISNRYKQINEATGECKTKHGSSNES